MPASFVVPAIVKGILAAIAEGMDAPPPAPPMQTLERPFHGVTAVGKLVGPPRAGFVWIDEKQMPASGALQIRNQMNLIVMPATLPPNLEAKIRYQLDAMGQVWRIWILTPAEIAALDLKEPKQPEPPKKPEKPEKPEDPKGKDKKSDEPKIPDEAG